LFTLNNRLEPYSARENVEKRHEIPDVMMNDSRVSPTLLSIVIPLYNEQNNVPVLVEKVSDAMARLELPYELILVNDGSSDNTLSSIQSVAAENPHIKGVHLRRNYGQTAAMVAGFDHANGDVIVTLDGDLQNDPEDILVLLRKLAEGYDVVSGWREDRKDEALRRNLPSLLANRIISRATGIKLHDFGCSLKAYRRSVIRHVHLYGEMHRFIPIYAVLSGARLAEVPVRHHPRLHGKSNYGLERVFKVVFDLMVVVFLQRYAQKPMYLFGTCGALSFLGSVAAAAGALYYKFFGGKTLIETPLPLASGFLFLTGVLCMLLGLLAELSIRIYHETQDKPTYLIAGTDNIQARRDAT
jgi:glycosyltransferase involved in cell wall biosynthesis